MTGRIRVRREVVDGISNLVLNVWREEGKVAIRIGLSSVKVDKQLIMDMKLLAQSDDEEEGDVYWACLGVMRVEGEDFVFLVREAVLVGELEGSPIYQVKGVQALSITNAITTSTAYDPLNTTGSKQIQMATDYLSQGAFYYSPTRDLSFTCQQIALKNGPNRICDDYLAWNGFLLEPVERFMGLQDEESRRMISCCMVFPRIIKGFVGVYETPSPSSSASMLWVISRVSRERAGTRSFFRGLDDDGHVANHVETETILTSPTHTFSYVIIRGSVPVFWEQQGSLASAAGGGGGGGGGTGGKMQLTRAPIATQPAFERHVRRLGSKFGLVHCLNLLSAGRDQSEQLLSSALEYHVRRMGGGGGGEMLELTQYDLNRELLATAGSATDRLEEMFGRVSHEVPVFSYFVSEARKVIRRQRGVFRVNCFDCLDRTNIAQHFISGKVLDLFLRNYTCSTTTTTMTTTMIRSPFNDLWADNGDTLSLLSTGAPALKSSITRSGHYHAIRGALSDAHKSVRRLYTGQFVDGARNGAIRVVLGWGEHRESVRLHDVFYLQDQDGVEGGDGSTDGNELEELLVQCVTWNVNGLVPDLQDFRPLLLAPSGRSPDIIVCGFQEIVALNPSQIISVDPERRLSWERHILAAIKDIHSTDSTSQSEYSLLVSNQMVGITVSVFIRNRIVGLVRSVEVGKRMTGLGGMAGNKGSVVVWMAVQKTSLCFVSSHFAAGQANISDRNDDWRSVYYELASPSGLFIPSRDTVVWMGDMNYRLECPRELVLHHLSSSPSSLMQYDQLTSQMASGAVFTGFQEAPISFPPTYKFDPGTNTYDTSEKARVPSYTDRILVKSRRPFSFLGYERGEIDFSDHKPVTLLLSIQLKDTAAPVPPPTPSAPEVASLIEL